MATNNTVTVVTDGSCIGNPGPGGWAFLVAWPRMHLLVSGASARTTNNAMELQAVLEGLKTIQSRSFTVIVKTDSTYVAGCLVNKAKANVELIEAIRAEAARFREVRFELVQGHNGDALNEAVHDAAIQAARTQKRTARQLAVA